MSRLGIDRLGNKAICFNQVDNHVPLTTIANEVVREVTDESVINGEVCVLNHELKVIVGFVEFIPEEKIRL